MAIIFIFFIALGKIISGLLLVCAGLLWLVNLLFFIIGCRVDGMPIFKWPLVARFMCIAMIIGAGVTFTIYGCMQFLYLLKMCVSG
jgi:hypothetical protein